MSLEQYLGEFVHSLENDDINEVDVHFESVVRVSKGLQEENRTQVIIGALQAVAEKNLEMAVVKAGSIYKKMDLTKIEKSILKQETCDFIEVTLPKIDNLSERVDLAVTIYDSVSISDLYDHPLKEHLVKTVYESVAEIQDDIKRYQKAHDIINRKTQVSMSSTIGTGVKIGDFSSVSSDDPLLIKMKEFADEYYESYKKAFDQNKNSITPVSTNDFIEKYYKPEVLKS